MQPNLTHPLFHVAERSDAIVLSVYDGFLHSNSESLDTVGSNMIIETSSLKSMSRVNPNKNYASFNLLASSMAAFTVLMDSLVGPAFKPVSIVCHIGFTSLKTM